ncbi:hypothetical protein CPB86DRAFT_692097, partial [Serendipita vermifera]
ASTTNQAPASQQQPTKRSSRRANTAERRATHNAVERARRETLNGRFLDLAALLPNLAAVRRPSKSAIVNSSIALIHNQRRSRIIAARELRLIKTENDALRQELNEWRQRNSLPRVEEPPRSSDLIALLNLEEELEDNAEMMMNNRRAFDLSEGAFEDDEYNDDDGDEQLSPESAHPYAPGAAMSLNIAVPQKALPVNTLQQQQQMQFAAQQQQQQQQQALFEQQKAAMARSQMINAGARYAQQAPVMPQQQFMFNENLFPTDMYTTDNTNAMYGGAQTWSQKAIAAATNALHTPPGSAHGLKASPFANTANTAFLSNSPYNGQHMNMFKQGFMNGNAGSEDGDNSSVGEGSSHFSGSEMGNIMGTSPIEHPFAYNMGVGLGMQVPLNMTIPMPLNMTMPPSPPHSISPDHSNPQSRRASVNI